MYVIALGRGGLEDRNSNGFHEKPALDRHGLLIAEPFLMFRRQLVFPSPTARDPAL